MNRAKKIDFWNASYYKNNKKHIIKNGKCGNFTN